MTSKLYVTEYADMGTSKFAQVVQTGAQPHIATSVVDYSGGSAQSPVFNYNTAVVRIHTDSICSILFGTNPTALTTSPRLAANQTEYFAIPQGQSYRVAAVINT